MKIAAHLKTQSNPPDLDSNFPQKIFRSNYLCGLNVLFVQR